MAQDYSDIQNAFLDGIEEVFTTMFTDRILMYRLNAETTEVNVYGESTDKQYREPINVVGKITSSMVDKDIPIGEFVSKYMIRIPTKQFITNKIPHTSREDLKELEGAKFSYNGEVYLVDKVTPTTLVADVFQFFDFLCTREKRSSVR